MPKREISQQTSANKRKNTKRWANQKYNRWFRCLTHLLYMCNWMCNFIFIFVYILTSQSMCTSHIMVHPKRRKKERKRDRERKRLSERERIEEKTNERVKRRLARNWEERDRTKTLRLIRSLSIIVYVIVIALFKRKTNNRKYGCRLILSNKKSSNEHNKLK